MIEIQQAVYNALTNYAPLTSLISGVYDQAPQPAAYPYVLIGEDTNAEWDTDDRRGVESAITVHIWSIQRGRKETQIIQRKIYEALHQASLSVTGYQFVVCYFVTETTLLDVDGLATHGVSKYRINIAGG